MDKSDYSEVKELITTNSNCATNSPFDGDSVVFYGSTKDDSFQKGGHLRSFRKIGADNASRHDLKGTYNNQRSEKDPSAWAMVHEVGHGLHFAEAAADIAFITKNALALRDAHSKESLTAPFKSIQTPATEKPTAADESRPASKHSNGNAPSTRTAATGLVTATNHGTSHHNTTNNNNNNNNSNPNSNPIFSFNSSRNVKAVLTEAASEPYDDDSNFEKDSTASFDFNRHRASANPLTKPTPSKWDDAEKWLSGGESAPAKTRPRNSPLAGTTTTTTTTTSSGSQRKAEAYPNPDVDPESDGEMVPDMSPEKMNKFLVKCTTTKKVEALGSKKSLLPRFAFLASGKPLPLPLPAATVDRYPLEDVFRRDDSNARDSSDAAHHHEPFSVRTAKPTAGVTIDSAAAKAAGNNNNNLDEATKDASCDAGAVYEEAGAVMNMRTVCMRDMGTEMTPMASVDPSRTATPLMATTPNLGSPAISRPCSPGRVRTTTPASGSTAGANKALVAAGKAANGLSGKEKTRAEILALGTQLGKANIAAWATKEEEEADAAQALKASLEMEEVRKNLLASRAAAWEEAEQAKYTARFKREEAKIQAWENHEKAKAEAEMRRVEVKVERMRSHANEKLMNKLAAARRRAEDLRAKAEAVRCEQATKTSTRSEHIRRTGRIPTSFFTLLCG